MRDFRLKLVLVITLMIFTACSSVTAEPSTVTALLATATKSKTATPFPYAVVRPVSSLPGLLIEGIGSSETGYQLVAETICLYIREDIFGDWKSFWDDWEDTSPVSINVDGQLLEQLQLYATHDHLAWDYDEFGNEAPIGWSSFRYCFTPKLESGKHMLSTQITATSGQIYAYSWEFYVD
jgi:hypothetical protein